MQKVEKCFSHLKKLFDACDQLKQPSYSAMEKGAMRRSQKNQEKKKIRADKKMESSIKKPRPSYQETVDRFFCKKDENVMDVKMNIQ